MCDRRSCSRSSSLGQDGTRVRIWSNSEPASAIDWADESATGVVAKSPQSRCMNACTSSRFQRATTRSYTTQRTSAQPQFWVNTLDWLAGYR